MFQNAYRYGRLPREGKEAGSFEVAWEAMPDRHRYTKSRPAGWTHFVKKNGLSVPGSVITTCLPSNLRSATSETVTLKALTEEKTVIEAHIHRYREILNLQTQYWRELSRSYPEGMSPVLRRDLDEAIDEISRTGADSQASERLAHYALVFAEMTSIDGPFPKLQSCIREYIIKKLDPILSSLHPQTAKVFDVLKKEWRQS
ncbi:hypothetical protein MJO28_013761 [Puccinia striiformis f. sp. tritici]|uniref:Uncharacterized protein n=1 Tax=Puccinia striiformis f. sp. tritici TaxID=168172 RepID=A0ACC0DXD8_9BASI|nr:hypothetical protein MJO28_013761 [Puccinia striiformis f. sp. tritici]